MVDPALLGQARQLSHEERWELIDALREIDDTDPQFSPEFLAMIDERRADVDANPDDHVPWEDVRAELHARIAAQRGR